VITLWPFQADARAAIEAAWTAGTRRQLVAWATGLGKTVLFAHVLAGRPGRGLVLVHRDELLRQAVDKVRLVMPAATVGVVQAEHNEPDAPLVVASVQTLSRRHRLATFGADFTTVVVDEAHHATAPTYQRVLEHVGAFRSDGPLLLGVTATPFRHDRDALGAIFAAIVHRQTILDGITGGYLCDLEARRLHVAVDLDRIPTRAGDLDEAATEAALLAAQSQTVLAEALVQHARARKRILVFTAGVTLAHAVATAARDRGLPAEAVDGAMALEARRAVLARFAAGETRVVTNCALLTEGFDEPGIDCIVMARPTRSRGLYTQMLGRGTRRSFGKTTCLVLDLVGVGHRFDLVTMPDLVTGELVEQLGREGAVDVRMAVRSGQALGTAVRDAFAARAIEFRETVVNLFASGKLLWVPMGEGFRIDVGVDRVGVERAAAGAADWRVVHCRPSGVTEVWRGPSIEYAQGIAEQYVTDLNPPGWCFRGRWCDEPPTDKQRALLERYGLWTAGLTRGQATERISKLIRSWEQAG
jgi:superfamily II DNA or RNA helicase